MGKTITRDLIDKIEEVTLEKMRQAKVVSLSEFRRTKTSQQKNTILIIDDDETMRQALQKLLERAGHRVLALSDAIEMNTILGEHLIDLIILDVGLPWINGYELAELIKANQNLREIPLIFISGRNDFSAIKIGFDKGADDYLTKPVENKKLLSAVETLLNLNQN